MHPPIVSSAVQASPWSGGHINGLPHMLRPPMLCVQMDHLIQKVGPGSELEMGAVREAPPLTAGLLGQRRQSMPGPGHFHG